MDSDIGSLPRLIAGVKVIYLIVQQCGSDYMESSCWGQDDDRDEAASSPHPPPLFLLCSFQKVKCTGRWEAGGLHHLEQRI